MASLTVQAPQPTPEAGRRQSGRFYRPELDVLRFFAFMLVFLHHALRSSGWIGVIRNSCASGVCLFFFLSAYLITELMELEILANGRLRLSAFYMRRVLRIWPLYFAILFLDYFFPGPNHHAYFGAGRLLACILMVGNVYAAFHGFALTLSTPLWSISVEEQFYLLWPNVRKFCSPKVSAIFSIAMLGVAYVTLWVLSVHHANVAVQVWVNSFVQFQFFSTGAILALVWGRRPNHLNNLARIAFFLGGLMLFFTAQAVFQVKESPSFATFDRLCPGYLCLNLACILIFVSVLGAKTLARAKPLIYLGKISYGLYVFHQGSLVLCSRLVQGEVKHGRLPQNAEALVTGVASLAVTIVLAALSYRYFERPMLRFKQRFEVIRTRPA